VRRSPGLIPTLLRFPSESARQDSWGRLLKLTSGGAELSTAVRLLKGEILFLSFDLGGDALEAVRARVEHAEDDADGRRLAELKFLDEVQRRALAKALTDVLSRS